MIAWFLFFGSLTRWGASRFQEITGKHSTEKTARAVPTSVSRIPPESRRSFRPKLPEGSLMLRDAILKSTTPNPPRGQRVLSFHSMPDRKVDLRD